MHDATKLKKLTCISNGQKHVLNARYSKHGGLFCDLRGSLDPVKIRRVYMMGGLIPPQSDNAEELFLNIQNNIVLLNEYLNDFKI